MTVLSVVTLTSRTVTLLVAPPGTKYALGREVAWRLLGADGRVHSTGKTEVAPLFIEGLDPGQRFTLVTDLGELAFETPLCAGLVDATDHGVSASAADNSEAFAQAIAAVPQGGTLRVPPGRYVTRPLFLKPHITVYLPHGAEIAAPDSRDRWPILPARDGKGRVIGTWEGLPEASYASLLTALDCHGLAITGRGTLDAGGSRGDWWSWHKETRHGARRARSIFVAHSTGVSLSGVRVQNSPAWTIHPYRCTDFAAAALTINSPADSPNTDGLNPESCENVDLVGLNISVGDDCIAIKSGKRAPGQTDHLAPTRNIRISHSRMAFGHGAVVLGSEMSGEISDVTIRDCVFEGTDRGLRLKTRRGRGGRLARVLMENVEMDGVATPFVVNAFYYCDPDGHSDLVQSRAPAEVTQTTPVVEDITVRDVVATNVTLAVAAVLGLPEAPATSIRLERVSASFDPAAKPDVPLMADGMAPVRHARLIAEFAEVQGAIDLLPHAEDAAAC